jgi:hypothetical protein
MHRLFDHSSHLLSKTQPESTGISVQADQSTRGSARAAFTRAADLATGEGSLASQPVASVLSDLDEDGRPDLVTAFANSLVTVRLGKVDGSFGPPTPYSIDAQVSAMAAGDFNGDGHLDLLVADATAQSLLILAGDGRGGLPQAQRVPLAGAPSRLVVKDFLGDQRAEVLVAMTKGTQTELLLWTDLAWLRPMPEATLKTIEPRTLALPPTELAVPIQGAASRVDVGYVDSDSYSDIIVVGEQHISVLFGDHTAPFQRSATVALEQTPLDSVIGDFNGDVRADVAVLDSLSHDVILYTLNSDGQWGVRDRLNVGAAATALAVADANGDRVDDLVVIRSGAQQVAVYLGGRQSQLGGALVNTIHGEPVMALPAYLDRDELTDLVVIKQQGVSLLLTTDSAEQAADGGVGDSPITSIDPLEYDVEVPEGECRTVPITITIAPTVFRPLDIYLLVDDTQSFNDNIPNFVKSADKFVDDLLALRGDIRLGIGKFRDYPIRPFGTLLDFAYKRVLDLKPVNTANRADFIKSINGIVTEGGGDDPEAQLPALFQAATGAGQTFPPAQSRANIDPNQQASFRRNVDVEKVVVLLTDSNFHNAGDPGNIPYPGPTFANTVAALNAQGIKVIGVAAGGPGGNATITINALRQIATATKTFARRDIDCDGNGTVDIHKGDPIVCPPPSNGVALKDVILSVVRGFDLPVPLTLEIDRDCSPITFMINPPVQFVNPLTGGSFTFNVTFCAPCPSAPSECRFETKVILDEIIRARIPSRVVAVRPICQVSATSVDFGDVCQGASADRTITISNTGNGSFALNAINSDNPAFSVVSASPPLPATIAPGGSVNATIRFTCAGAPGAQSGTISFVTDPSKNCVTNPLCAPVAVSGFCVNIAGDVAPRTIGFGNVCVGSNTTSSFTVSNTGNRAFTVTPASNNPAFTVSPASATLNPTESATFTVTFTCTASGPQSGTITLNTSNANNCPFDLGTVSVSGTCLQAAGNVSPASIDFGDVCVGASADQTFTINNTGNTDITVNAITSSNAAFTITSPALPVTIPAGGSATVTVHFTCTTPGPQSGTISLSASSTCGAVSLGTVSVTGFCVQIAGNVSPASIDFGDVCVGSSANQNFTVNNTGNRPFTITAINSSNGAFSIVSPALPATVPAGGSVTVTVQLTCTAPGPQSGTISVSADSACGPVSLGTVSVTGFCVQITCAVSPASLNFGNVCVGSNATQSFTVSNTGNRPFTITAINSSNGAFSIVGPALPVTIPAGGSTTVTVQFTCTALGPQSGAITFTTTSACGPIDCGSVSVSGTCIRITCAVSPASLDFGSVCVGSSADRTFTVSNTGNGDFTITAINSSNGAFSIVSPALPVTVPAGGSVSVTARLTCTAPGPQSGTITFTTTSACGAIDCGSVSVSGTCLQATGNVSPASIDFGDVCVGASTNRTFTINNTGNTPITVNAITSSNAAFTITSPALPVTIPAGGSVTVTARLTCTTPGPQSGTISLSASSTCGAVSLGTVSVSGFCVQISCAVSPTSLDFGNVCVGSSADRTFTVTNTGNRSFIITSINSTNAAFSIVSPALPVSLSVGGSVTVTARLTCTSLGPQSGTLSISTDSACGPAACSTVSVSGTCVQITGSVSPAAVDFGDVCVGSSADRIVTVTNTGNGPFTITAISSSNAAFSVVSPALPVTVPVGGSVAVTVRLTCTTPGAQSGTLSFAASSDCGPVSLGTVSLSGFCVQITCAVSPTSLDFGSVCVGASADRVITVSNTGNRPFTITAISSSNAAFSVVSPALPVTVPAGGSINVVARLSCTAPGPQSTTFSFTTTSACGPVACASVSGTGTCLQITGSVSPSPVNFGDVCVGSSADRTFTITNTGNGPFTVSSLTPTNAAFSVLSPALPITLNPGQSATVTVRLTCTTPGQQVGSITVSADSPCGTVVVGVVDLIGFCAQITCNVLPRTIDFGDVCVGASAQQTFKVQNTGNRPFTVNAINSSNPAFTIVGPALPVTLPAGGSTGFIVQLTCTSLGPQSGTISFVTDSQCGPVDCGTVTVTGNCVQAICAVAPTSVNFGDVMAGTSSTQTVTVSNTGNIPFTITAASSTDAAFSVVSPPLPATVAPGGSVAVTIRFACASGDRAAHSGTISFTTSSSCGPVACPGISVSGQCFVGAICRVAPASIDFGTVLVRDCITGSAGTATQTTQVCNDGDRPLTITAASSDNPRFTVLTALPITIAPGTCASITVQFEAREAGLQAGVISFTTNATNPTACVLHVTGIGVIGPLCIFIQPPATPPDYNFDLPFPNIVVGSTTTQNGAVQIFNSGDQPLVINKGGQRPSSTNLSFTIDGFDLDGILPPDGPLDLPLSPNPAVPAPEITIAPGDSVFMLVRFTGIDIGSQIGAIRVFTNECVLDPNNPPCVLKNVRGVVVRPPQCVLTPTALTLSAFANCTVAQDTVTVANTGGLNLVINNITISNPDVTVIDPLTNAPPALPVSVPPGSSVQFVVRCTPLTVGTRTATIRFVTNDPNPSACVLNVTCVATAGPICQVVMPDTVNGAPDGKTFGEVAIVPASDPRFGMNVGGVQFGEKRLPIELRNVGDSPLVLTPPPGPPFTTNPFVTNTNFIVEGFTVGQTILPGGAATGTVIFRPTLRRLQKGAIRFFTNTCVGECVIAEVNGVGIANALCQIPISLDLQSTMVGTSRTATFLMINRGDLPLVISQPIQIITDNAAFSVTTPLPITVPPEFSGGAAGVPITVRFTPSAPGQQIGRIQFNFDATVIGPIAPCVLNVSGTGTVTLNSTGATKVVGDTVPVPIAGGTRPVAEKQE